MCETHSACPRCDQKQGLFFATAKRGLFVQCVCGFLREGSKEDALIAFEPAAAWGGIAVTQLKGTYTEEDRMRVVYVAGPFRAASGWLVELNIRRAEMMAFRVAEAGGVPLCPHTMYRYFNGVLTDHFWLEGTKELLRRCDAIVLLNEWQTSEGSRGERDLAIHIGKRVFYECAIHNLLAWLRDPSRADLGCIDSLDRMKADGD